MFLGNPIDYRFGIIPWCPGPIALTRMFIQPFGTDDKGPDTSVCSRRWYANLDGDVNCGKVLNIFFSGPVIIVTHLPPQVSLNNRAALSL